MKILIAKIAFILLIHSSVNGLSEQKQYRSKTLLNKKKSLNEDNQSDQKTFQKTSRLIKNQQAVSGNTTVTPSAGTNNGVATAVQSSTYLDYSNLSSQAQALNVEHGCYKYTNVFKRQCTTCKLGYKSDGQGGCLLDCKDANSITQNGCTECAAGYVKTANNKCVVYVENCAYYNSDVTIHNCVQCKDKNWLLQVQTKYATWYQNTVQSQNGGSFGTDSVYIKLLSPIIQLPTEYILSQDNLKCIPKIPNCLTQIDEKCTACSLGSYLVDQYTCCLQCQPGYIYQANTTPNTGGSCSLQCQNIDPNDPDNCLQCPPGFISILITGTQNKIKKHCVKSNFIPYCVKYTPDGKCAQCLNKQDYTNKLDPCAQNTYTQAVSQTYGQLSQSSSLLYMSYTAVSSGTLCVPVIPYCQVQTDAQNCQTCCPNYYFDINSQQGWKTCCPYNQQSLVQLPITS